MRGKPVHGGSGARGVERGQQVAEQPPSGDGRPMRGHPPGVAAGAHGQGLLEQGLHPAREADLWVHHREVPTTAQEMGQTGLMGRVRELPIGCPPVPSRARTPAYSGPRTVAASVKPRPR